jgi:uncharacterized membrane protein
MDPNNPVVEQSRDNSWWNRDPLVVKAAVVGFATSIAVALGAFGLITEEQRDIIITQVGNITVGVVVLAPLVISLVTALWARLSVFSPRTAAKIAVLNASRPAGSEPTLLSPP